MLKKERSKKTFETRASVNLIMGEEQSKNFVSNWGGGKVLDVSEKTEASNKVNKSPSP